ncbi:MAG: OmpA family protein [Elusimicrobiota bacterium]|nr:OmpA family protein [Elusimicrobiota bacterium]
MNIKQLGRTAILTVLAAALGACAGGKKAEREAAAAAAAAAAARAASSEEPRIQGSLYVETSELSSIRFDYDRDMLTQEARAALKRNAAVIKENRSWEVLVEGHADERGTIPYNLALGQKRAKAVRDYYLALGIPGGRIATLSLGKEKPECAEANEACWERNRRALSKVKAALAGKPGGAKRHE